MLTTVERPQWAKGAGAGACAKIQAVGLNPFRQQRRSPADYVLVAAAVIVVLAMVAWAFLG